MSSKAKIVITCAVAVGIAAVLRLATSERPALPMLTYSQFLEEVRTGRVASVTVIGGKSGATPANCRLKNGDTLRTVLPSDYRDALTAMQDYQVDIEIRDSFSGPLQLLLKATPFLLILGVWLFFIIRRFPNGPRQAAMD